MPGSSTDRFTDADDYQASLAAIFAGFIVTRPGIFSARTARATLRHMRLLRAEEALARVAYVSLPPEMVVVSFSANPAMPLIWRGIALEPDEIMLHGRGERLHQRTVGASCWGFIMLPPASFAAHCKTETGSTIALPEAGQILRPSAPDRRNLDSLHGEAARLAETRPKILAPAAVVRAMEYELGGLLVRCLTNSETRIAGAAIRQAAEIMTRFENVLTADPHRGLDYGGTTPGYWA